MGASKKETCADAEAAILKSLLTVTDCNSVTDKTPGPQPDPKKPRSLVTALGKAIVESALQATQKCIKQLGPQTSAASRRDASESLESSTAKDEVAAALPLSGSEVPGRMRSSRTF